jgi:hypothetical protein
MTEEQKTKLTGAAIALGLVYLAYRFGPSPLIKTAAASVGAVIVAKQIPFVGPAMA